MIAGWETCPRCGLAPVRKNGRDRRGQQVYECKRCGRSFTHLSGTPFSGYLCWLLSTSVVLTRDNFSRLHNGCGK